MSWWEKLLESPAVPLIEPTHGLTYPDSIPLGSSTRVAASKSPVAHREEQKCLASRQELGDSFLPDRKAGRATEASGGYHL